MKIAPQDRPQSLFPVSCIESIDFGNAIESCKTDSPPAEASVTFVGSEKAFGKFSQGLPVVALKLRFCPSLDLLLRSGLYQESNLFVVPQTTSVARTEDIEDVLSRRCHSEIKVVTWDEESTDDVIESVEQAMLELKLSRAKERITEGILDRSREWARKHDDLDPREDNPFHSSDAGLLDESQFKDFIRLKLEQHLDSTPEKILSKAIEAIRK